MTGAATLPSPPRGRTTRAERERAAMEASLVPVVDAILGAATARAEATRAAAAADARAELARARDEATRTLDEARAEGIEASAATAAAPADHGPARGTRDRARGTPTRVRDATDGAVEALVLQASSPDGRRLAERLLALVRERVGASASVHAAGPGNLGAVAESGNRRAELEPGELVDQALESLGAGIEALWA